MIKKKLNICQTCGKECKAKYCCPQHRKLDFMRYTGEPISEAIKRMATKRRRLTLKNKK